MMTFLWSHTMCSIRKSASALVVLICFNQLLLVVGAISEEECINLPEPKFFEPGTYNTTALASFQGSGNTWVRQLLALSTGYKTGDIYKSYGDDNYPEFSSKRDDTVIAIKTHVFSYPSADSFKRALVVSRNPIDALYAEFNRMFGGNKTGFAAVEHILNVDGSTTWKWDVWLSHITAWLDFHRFWLTVFEGPVHVIYYNNLKSNLREELSSAVKFLTGADPDPIRLECVLLYPKKPYFKRPRAPDIDKTNLFVLANPKQDLAISIFSKLIIQRFGENSRVFKQLNMTRGDQINALKLV